MNPNRDPKKLQEVGNRIKAAREALGLSQKDIYDALGVGASTWHNWESGKRAPDPFVMANLQILHGITLDWIYVGDSKGLPESIMGKAHKTAS
jgi:transcriptional regulator with XRE-family HTH domain